MIRRLVSAALIAAAVAVASLLAAGCQAPGAVLKGRLTVSSSGTNPVGVSVAVYSNATQSVVAQTVTDSQGDYSFVASSLPDGTYRVLFSSSDWWNHAGDWADATPVVVAAAHPVTINETLTPATGAVTGTVTDGATNPIAGVTVAAIDTANTTVASATTAPDGTYGFSSLPAGSYVFKFTAPGYTTRYNNTSDTQGGAPAVVVGDGAAVTGIDTTLDSEARITGLVTNGTNPLTGILVVAYDSDGNIVTGTTTASDGTFSLVSLDANPYTIELIDPTGAMHTEVLGSTSTDVATGTPVTPPAGGTANVGLVGLVGHDCHLDGTPYPTNLSSTNLTDCNLTGVNLSGDSLAGANLTNALLSGATLTGVDLTSANLGGATLVGVVSGGVTGTPAALPTGWVITDGYLAGPGANLTDATLTGADLEGADLTGATLTGVVSGDVTGDTRSVAHWLGFTDGYLVGPGANLTNATLTAAALTGADLDGADLTGATLTGVVSGGITGTPAVLPTGWVLTDGYLIGPGANLTNVAPTGASLANANLRGADLTDAALSTANLSNADLTGATLTGAQVNSADLTGATPSGVVSGGITGTPAALPANWILTDGYLIGPGANLAGANLSGGNSALLGADFAGANLTGANLNSASPSGANFAAADLTSADLTAADLGSVTLTGAILTSATLTRVQSGFIVGTPAALPTNWTVTDGYLIGPGADLLLANLTNVDLSNADLAGAILVGAHLVGANLTAADLAGADLDNANLSSANLTNADLDGANLNSANLTGVVSGGITGTPAVLPTGWTLVGGVLIGPG